MIPLPQNNLQIARSTLTSSTKEARISNLYKEAPEFREQIDILA